MRLLGGWLAGIGRPAGERMLIGLASANRNVAAALVIAASIGGDTIVYTLVGALTIPVVLIVLAGQIGRRAAATGGQRIGPLPARRESRDRAPLNDAAELASTPATMRMDPPARACV